MNPLISIIVPVYNVEDYLRKCLDSILAQTYKNLEIILVDDGSTDSSGSICDSYAQKDKRIQVYHKENGGAAAARNYGLDRFSGEYLMFVDSDDFITKDAVEHLYQRILQDGSDMAVGQLVKVDSTSITKVHYIPHPPSNIILTKHTAISRIGLKDAIHCGPVAKLYRASIWKSIRFQEYLRVAEDEYLFPHILDKCTIISILSDVIYYYLQRSTSLMHTKNEAAILDDITSCLHVARFCFNRNMLDNSRIYFGSILVRCIPLSSRRLAFDTIKSSFSPSERRLLLRGWKMKMRWLCLRIPGLYYILRPIWDLIKKKQEE